MKRRVFCSVLFLQFVQARDRSESTVGSRTPIQHRLKRPHCYRRDHGQQCQQRQQPHRRRGCSHRSPAPRPCSNRRRHVGASERRDHFVLAVRLYNERADDAGGYRGREALYAENCGARMRSFLCYRHSFQLVPRSIFRINWVSAEEA